MVWRRRSTTGRGFEGFGLRLHDKLTAAATGAPEGA